MSHKKIVGFKIISLANDKFATYQLGICRSLAKKIVDLSRTDGSMDFVEIVFGFEIYL